MQPFILRPDQTDLIHRTRLSVSRGNKRVLVQAPTGAGKTVIMAEIARQAESKNKLVYFLVPRQELRKQASRAFDRMGVSHGCVAPNVKPTTSSLQNCMVRTLLNRVGFMSKPDIIMVDEAHMAVSKTYMEIFDAWPDSIILGFTATPQRLDGQGLDVVFEDLVIGPSIRTLIDEEKLSDYIAFAPPGVDLSSVGFRGGDFDAKQLGEVVDKPTITGDLVEHYVRHAKGLQAIYFAVNVRHSRHIADAFRAVGIDAEHADATFPQAARDKVIDNYSTEKTKVFTNVDLVTAGFDVPNTACIGMGCATQSLTKYLQQVGRGLRYVSGKTAVILDHAGNIARHGLPCMDREWSLEGKKRTKKDAEDAEGFDIMQCAVCFAVMPRAGKCSECGEVIKKKQRTIDEIGGELVPISREDFELFTAARKELMGGITADTSMEELEQIGKRLGYKKGWAKHQYNRERKPDIGMAEMLGMAG